VLVAGLSLWGPRYSFAVFLLLGRFFCEFFHGSYLSISALYLAIIGTGTGECIQLQQLSNLNLYCFSVDRDSIRKLLL